MANANVAIGDRFAATVTETKTYGVIVRLGDSGLTALLHVSRIAGGSRGAQARRLAKDLTVGATTEVEVVAVDREGKRAKVSVSEKSLQDARVLAELTPGTAVRGEVVGKREFGAFVRLHDGVAAGVEGLLHVSELAGHNPEARDKALAALAVGAQVNAEVLAVRQDESGDLRVSLSLRAEERRVIASRYGVGTVHTGRVAKRVGEGFLVSFGAVTGFLPFAELGKAGAGSVRVGGNVRAKIVEIDDRMRAQLTRRGL
jgi:ribosomal protein S1